MSNIRILGYIIPIFIGWRTALIIITYFGLSFLPTTNPVTNELFPPNKELIYWDRWGHWDGGHFRSIAENGYQSNQTVFFPFYPLLIKFFMFFGISSFWAGFTISQIGTLTALFFLYKLALTEFDQKIAKKSVLSLLLFPTSFYLVSVYSESLFLALTLGAFYFAQRKKWFLAYLLAGFSAVTRILGVAVIMAVSSEMLLKNVGKFNISSLWQTMIRRISIYLIFIIIILHQLQNIFMKSQVLYIVGIIDSISQILFPILLLILTLALAEFIIIHLNFKPLFSYYFFYLLVSLVPIFAYLFYQQAVFNNPFSFINNYSLWHTEPTLPWEAPKNYFLYMIAFNPVEIGGNLRFPFHLSFFTITILGLLNSFKKLKFSYVLYYISSLLIILSTGSLLEFLRYLVTVFPIFFYLAYIKNQIIQLTGALIFAFLLGALSILFINNYWFM